MKRAIIWGVVALVVIAAATTVLITSFNQKKETTGLEKSISLTIDYGDGTSDEYTINTTKDILKDALDEKNLLEGENSQYGFFITGVNSVKADEKLKQWWKLTKGGQMVNTGISSVKIADGDKYELTLTTGYEE